MRQGIVTLVIAALCVILLASLAYSDPRGCGGPKPNPLSTAPLPICGPVNEMFNQHLTGLKQYLQWRGQPEHQKNDAELKLYVGRKGDWTLFFHAYTDKGERVCAVSRGTDSVAAFGRPM